MNKTCYALIIGIITIVTLVNATDFDPNQFKDREIVAVRLISPLNIDGNLDEQLYTTQASTDFVQYVPLNGHPATEKTDVWIGYDESAIYVGARMWDSEPNLIVSRIGRRDENDNSDLFEVIFDSYHDKRTGFSFQINPVGAINDETYYNDGFTERSWDGIWEGKTNIDEKGWTAELRIPYSQLRFNEKDEYIWGFQSARYIQRKDEWNYFAYQTLEESGLIRHAADLTGLHDISPPNRTEIRPYITAGASILPGKKDNPFYEGKDTNIGLGADFKFGIGSNITVDGTINPDFGQVEADPSEINLSAYETYYDEKRPFFIEGQNIFLFGRGGPTNNFNINFSEPRLFYSRRIGREPQGWVPAHPDSVQLPGVTNILGAAKVSGKIKGNWSVGGLTTLTNQEHSQYYSNGTKEKELVEPATFYNVIRAQKEFNEGKQGIGLIGTSVTRFMDGLSILGSSDEDHSLDNRLSENAASFGIDGWTFLGSNNDWGIGAWFGATQVSGSKDRILNLQKSSSHYFQRPDAEHVEIDENLTSLSGYAGRIKIDKQTGNVMVNAALGIISPGFESNDLGYQGATDVINKHICLGYHWTKPTKYYRDMYSLFGYANNHDFSRVKSAEEIIWLSQINFNNLWNMHGDVYWNFESLSNTALRGGPRVIEPASWQINQLGFHSDNRKNIT
ncbi:MAG: carbohydrate binding family 9 domain-containing protein, partial [Candidatus Marinimicrobia bacterium]|nr:carbohydrate binding family 9 domain-containing protein [Candidatus Neomarinimicrobiota bacterium]